MPSAATASSCSLYEDFRADNEATVRQGAALPRRRRHRPGRAERSKPERADALHAAARAGPRGLGGARGRNSQAVKGALKTMLLRPGTRRRARADAERARPAPGAPPRSTRRSWRRCDRASSPEVVAFSDYVGEDFVARWGYEPRRLTTRRRLGTGGGQRIVPDFFIVGHAKCGTTALYEMLRTPSGDLHARPQGARLLRNGPEAALSSRRGRRVAAAKR